MKKKYIVAALITVIAVVLIAGAFKPLKRATIKSTPKGFALVELFTSEGCSSCPSADEAVARLLAKNKENVFILAYHVDYWNRLGWKDPFSKAEYSQRQSQYASKFNLSSIYTPQVIINGSSQFVGSDENKLNNIVEINLQKESSQHVSINTKRRDNIITVDYAIDGNDIVLLNLALVQPEATTSVKRGENGGRTLHHVNIVRSLKTVDAKGDGNVTIEIPNELSGIPLQIIAYTQSKKSYQILGVDQKEL